MATGVRLKRVLVAVLAVNLMQMLFCPSFWSWTSTADGRRILWERHAPASARTVIPALKPWPHLPSFKPWTRDPNLQPYTCEAYFGNGFTREHRVLESGINGTLQGLGKEERGSFRCFYSETLRVSLCEGRKLVMNLEKIEMARGGEVLEEVMGRNEDDELPEYSRGAFQIRVPKGGGAVFDDKALDEVMPEGALRKHPLRALLRNLEVVDSESVHCAQRITRPTIFVTRFEYANLFHTATDWFSAYVSSRVAGLAGRPHLVLLDGHCKSPMDDAWEAMFSGVKYAMHFRGPVCFDHAIFAPVGYATPLFKHITTTLECAGSSVEEMDKGELRAVQNRRMGRLREFGEFVASSFETSTGNSTVVESTARESGLAKEVNVLFVRREDYLAHPRHSGRPESRLTNEEEVYQELKMWAREKSTKSLKITIVNGLFAHITLREQIKTVRRASVLIGAHGAGLTHLLFSSPTTKVLELRSPYYKRPHFATMSYWMGMDYRVVEMHSSAVDVRHVVTKMNEIVEDVHS